jgi:hypothetical protein
MTVALITVSVNPELSVEIKDVVTKPRVNENTGCLTSDVVAVTQGSWEWDIQGTSRQGFLEY